MRGFAEVIGLAVAIVVVYLTLKCHTDWPGTSVFGTASELISTVVSRCSNGQLGDCGGTYPAKGTNWFTIIVLCFWFFPKLALGLSGFETGVAVMPLVRETGRRLKSGCEVVSRGRASCC